MWKFINHTNISKGVGVGKPDQNGEREVNVFFLLFLKGIMLQCVNIHTVCPLVLCANSESSMHCPKFKLVWSLE